MVREGKPQGGCVFLGTADFAVPSLQTLVAAGEGVSLVVTQPDRPRGRGRQAVPPPLKAAASVLSLPVYQPENINTADAQEVLESLAPEFLVVVAYGQILKSPLLRLPGRCAVNLHASLLPRHRGPSPIASTIWEGDAQAGNTTMIMEEGLDSGPILLQESLDLSPRWTRGDLESELSRRGGALLLETLRGLRTGVLSPTPQDPRRATWSRLLTRDMRPVVWGARAQEIVRQIQALSPLPGALSRVRGRLLKLLRAEVVGARADGDPGQVLEVRPEGPVVCCGEGSLMLREVQPEGRRPMSGGDFARGGGVAAGDRLEAPVDA